MEQLDLPQREALPVERVVDGIRYCRHHHDQPIRWYADPCELCRREGTEPWPWETDEDDAAIDRGLAALDAQLEDIAVDLRCAPRARVRGQGGGR